MRTAIITIIIMFLSVGICNVQASSPPWGGDEHYTFGDEDPFFVHGAIYDSASLDIVGGSFGSLYCFGYSAVNMTGGDGEWIQAYDSSDLYLSGGTLGSLRADEFSDVTFYADNYSIEPTGGIGWTGTLTGTWLDNGGQFEIMLWEDTLDHINFVPEPTTLLLVVLGALVARAC